MSSPAHGPRALDVHHGAKLRPSTHARYRAAAGKLVWLKQNQFSPNSAGEWDDLLVEWKSDSDLRKSDFEAAVAAVEFLMPHLRGKLSWTRAVLAGWASAHVARHTVPLCRGPAHLLACHLAADGHPRLAAGLVLQRELGLRPSEMLDLRSDNVTLPEQVPALRGRPQSGTGPGHARLYEGQARTGGGAARPRPVGCAAMGCRHGCGRTPLSVVVRPVPQTARTW